MAMHKKEFNVSSPPHIVTVKGYGSDGTGVALLEDGKVVFVRNAARGDVLEVRLINQRKRSAEAEIINMLTPSPYRIDPDCPVYPQCGGCDFRHITYEEELDLKLQRVNDAIERIGGQTARANEILNTGQTDGYRNKAVFHSDGNSLGFYQAGKHKVIAIDRCLLLKDDLNDALGLLREDSPSGISCLPREDYANETSCSARKRYSGFQVCPAPDGEITLRSGRNGLNPPLEEQLDGLVFQISGFFQVNTGAALLLFRKAREYAALSKNETLIDLYCGVGSLTLFVGRDAGHALGIELDPDAVQAARENAWRNNIYHVEFLCADAAQSIAAAAHPDCIIVDPPRRGLSPGATARIIELSPSRIVYVSCDPATLARDIRRLEGYIVKDITAVDMFPRTANVECCCLLEKVK